ncbi:hypothetical protein WMY93_025170 [Mugilogobius chulae]|uniref:Uncharacterized protein n=1 Tax=Mugilogobius chulae TaxID=88201 RepID=A0AAW0NC69_9GOBI
MGEKRCSPSLKERTVSPSSGHSPNIHHHGCAKAVLRVGDSYLTYLRLSPPSIISNEDEFILQPDSVFNISCTGKRTVVWAEPLPVNTFVYPGFYTATLFIFNATVENTGYYMCTYETFDGEPEDNEAGIYVFVPDPLAPFVPESRENLIVPMDHTMVSISCRVSDPQYHVVLKSVVDGEEQSALYDNKNGFFGLYLLDSTTARPP